MNKQDLEQMTEEEKAEYHESVKKRIDEMHEEVRKEREEKQRIKEERREAKRLAREERREARPLWVKVLSLIAQWGVVILILAWLGSSYGEELLARLNGEYTYKDVVLENVIDNNGGTVKDACDKFFIDGKYKTIYFKAEGDVNVVQISGKCYFMDKEVKITLQFLPHSRELGDYTVYTSTINSVPQNKLMTEALYSAICSRLDNSNQEITKESNIQDNSKQQVDDNNNKQQETDSYYYTFKACVDSVTDINSDNCVEAVKNARVGNKVFEDAFNAYYNNVSWDFSSQTPDGTFDVDMMAESNNERIKITFNITPNGDITVSNAIVSGLDSYDGTPISDNKLNSILNDVFK